MAKEVSRAFQTLSDSAVHDPQGSLPALKEKAPSAWPGVTYTVPDYNAFEKKLGKILTKEWIEIGGISLKGVQNSLGISIDFDLNERTIPKGVIARQVTNVSKATQVAIGNTIKQGIADGVHPSVIAKRMRDQLMGYAGLENLTKSRAYTIARTETANAYNVGTIIGYEKSGLVSQARCIDAPDCGWVGHNDHLKAHGRVVPLDIARLHPISHPNCVRAWAPVIAKQHGELQAPGVQPKVVQPAAPPSQVTQFGPNAVPQGLAPGGYGKPAATVSNAVRNFQRDADFGGIGGSALERWAAQLYRQAAAKGVTRDMLDALADYGGGGYRRMNAVARGAAEIARQGVGQSYIPEIKAQLRRLDAYINKTSLPEAVVTMRGTGSGRQFGLNVPSRDERLRIANSLIGTTHTEAGYYSAALHSNAAFGGVRLQMTVPKGYKAINVSTESKGQGWSGATSQSNQQMYEAEILLKRGAKYVIDKVEVNQLSGGVTLIGRILP
jgi:hypothetical protein